MESLKERTQHCLVVDFVHFGERCFDCYRLFQDVRLRSIKCEMKDGDGSYGRMGYLRDLDMYKKEIWEIPRPRMLIVEEADGGVVFVFFFPDGAVTCGMPLQIQNTTVIAPISLVPSLAFPEAPIISSN